MNPPAEPFELLGLPSGDRTAALEALLLELGEPSYRAQQIEEWVFTHGASSLDNMTTLPLRLRRELEGRVGLTAIEPAYVAKSVDGTIKHLWRLDDGEAVESVLIPTADRVTLCLSSQVGCALACEFCATGHFGFRRQLRAAEIVAQFREGRRAAMEVYGAEISNVVYMGMGEPLANFSAVDASLTVLRDGFGLGARRITISTVGLVPGILALAKRSEAFELAVSLHAPVHELRLELMPIEKRYPLTELFEALHAYQARKKRRISFEYTLIDGVNDALPLADELANRVRGLTSFVNLIPFNPIPDRPGWSPTPPGRVAAFARRLEARGIPSAVRTPRGRDIAAACGQLRLDQTPIDRSIPTSRERPEPPPAPTSNPVVLPNPRR